MKTSDPEPKAIETPVTDSPGQTAEHTCPLCGAAGSTRIWACHYESIWRSLASTWGATVSDQVKARHSPAPTTSLYQCERCGLQYFAPSVPGDPDFYDEVMASVGYWKERWEFSFVAERIGGAANVIDVGCGDGAFLRKVRSDRRKRLVGVDHNLAAVERLRRDGIEAYATDVTEIADRGAGSFDVVCAFQVLEHTPEPRSLVVAAKKLLAPEGRLFISVPNRDRIGRAPLEPFDCPPHHMTRWDAAQFEFLAAELGLSLESVSREPAAASSVRAPHRRRAERRLTWLGPRPAWHLARVYGVLRVPTPLHARRVRNGFYTARGEYGHTMLAEFRNPR